MVFNLPSYGIDVGSAGLPHLRALLATLIPRFLICLVSNLSCAHRLHSYTRGITAFRRDSSMCDAPPPSSTCPLTRTLLFHTCTHFLLPLSIFALEARATFYLLGGGGGARTHSRRRAIPTQPTGGDAGANALMATLRPSPTAAHHYSLPHTAGRCRTTPSTGGHVERRRAPD